jgi:hypothetical protein
MLLYFQTLTNINDNRPFWKNDLGVNCALSPDDGCSIGVSFIWMRPTPSVYN